MNITKAIRRAFFARFPRYRRIEVDVFTYSKADRLLKETADKPEPLRWTICPEYEDRNPFPGRFVFLERRERITQ